MGVTIRHWFNTVHARKGEPHWTWLLTVLLFIVIMWLSTVPKVLTGEKEANLAPTFQRFAEDAHFAKVVDTVSGRCSMCHAAEPVWEGITLAPKGVILDNDRAIAMHAREIYLQAGRSHAMPPGNVSEITDAERKLLVAWYESAIAGKTQ
jgi:uncharacterized membrane protein